MEGRRSYPSTEDPNKQRDLTADVTVSRQGLMYPVQHQDQVYSSHLVREHQVFTGQGTSDKNVHLFPGHIQADTSAFPQSSAIYPTQDVQVGEDFATNSVRQNYPSGGRIVSINKDLTVSNLSQAYSTVHTVKDLTPSQAYTTGHTATVSQSYTTTPIHTVSSKDLVASQPFTTGHNVINKDLTSSQSYTAVPGEIVNSDLATAESYTTVPAHSVSNKLLTVSQSYTTTIPGHTIGHDFAASQTYPTTDSSKDLVTLSQSFPTLIRSTERKDYLLSPSSRELVHTDRLSRQQLYSQASSDQRLEVPTGSVQTNTQQISSYPICDIEEIASENSIKVTTGSRFQNSSDHSGNLERNQTKTLTHSVSHTHRKDFPHAHTDSSCSIAVETFHPTVLPHSNTSLRVVKDVTNEPQRTYSRSSVVLDESYHHSTPPHSNTNLRDVTNEQATLQQVNTDLKSLTSATPDVTKHVMVQTGNMQFSCLFCQEKVIVRCLPEGHVLYTGPIDHQPDTDSEAMQAHHKTGHVVQDTENVGLPNTSGGLFGKKKAARQLSSDLSYSAARSSIPPDGWATKENMEDSAGAVWKGFMPENVSFHKEVEEDDHDISHAGRLRRKKDGSKLSLIVKSEVSINSESTKRSLRSSSRHSRKSRKEKSSPRTKTKSNKKKNDCIPRKFYTVTFKKKAKSDSKLVIKSEVKDTSMEDSDSMDRKQMTSLCVMCNKSIKGKDGMSRHLRLHISPKNYNCDVCGKSYHIPSHMLRHKSIVHEGIKPFACQICHKAFAKRDRLRCHMDSHAGLKRHLCTVCGMAFTQASNLHRHLSAHNSQPRFSCEICGKSFFQKINMVSHQRLHTGEKPFGCEICGKHFYQRSNLTSHQKIHGINKNPPRTDGVERPYVCEVCGKTFKRKAGLCTHKLSHADLKPYACQTCNKRFTQKTTLIQHNRLHTGEKPYPCRFCGKKFASPNNNKRHEMIHTGERPYKCEVCGKNFIQKVGLMAHSKVHDKREDNKVYVMEQQSSLEPALPSAGFIHPYHQWSVEQALKLHQQ